MQKPNISLKSFLKDPDLQLSFCFFCIWFLLLLVIGLSAQIVFKDYFPVDMPAFRTVTQMFLPHWDGGNFLEISQNGYTEKNLSVFFPFFPITVFLISKILFVNNLLAGIALNSLSTIFSIYTFLKLLKLDYDPKTAKKIVIFFLIFPTSFYLISFYSESLFVLFTLLSFYFIRTERKNPAVLSAIFASLTRLVGIVVVLSMIIEFRNSKIKNKFLYAAPFIGMLAIMCFWAVNAQDPFAFINSEANWNRYTAVPGVALFGYLSAISETGFSWMLVDVLFTVFGLGMAVRSVKHLRMSYAFYALVSVLLPLSTTNLISMPRFLLVVFPIFIVAGTIRKPIFDLSYILVCLSLLIIFWIRFNIGLWVS